MRVRIWSRYHYKINSCIVYRGSTKLRVRNQQFLQKNPDESVWAEWVSPATRKPFFRQTQRVWRSTVAPKAFRFTLAAPRQCTTLKNGLRVAGDTHSTQTDSSGKISFFCKICWFRTFNLVDPLYREKVRAEGAAKKMVFWVFCGSPLGRCKLKPSSACSLEVRVTAPC